MTELLTAAQMRAVEQAAIDAGDVTGLELMERAGQGVVDAIYAEWPEFAPAAGVGRGASPSRSPRFSGRDEKGSLCAVVLCGPGNNGGDGFVVARLLAERGWSVDVFLYGDAAKLPADARVNYERWLGIGTCSELTDAALDGYTEAHPGTALAIDALFGTGLTRPLVALSRVQGAVNDWQARWRTHDVPRVVSVDIPSGLCADSGRYLGSGMENPFDYAIMANLTVTFHREKTGHYLSKGPAACGALRVVDIGLDQTEMPDTLKRVDMAEPGFASLLQVSEKTNGHKFTHGHALILSGGSGRTGAARMSARGALRIGAGLVTLGVPPSAQMEVACQITSEMLMRISDAASLVTALEDARITALCLGPGLGQTRARDLVPAALASRRTCVLDADVLSAFADDPAALFAQLHEACVLTPHGGEFARLFPDIAARLGAEPVKGPAYSKVDAARCASARAGCVVLYKGADTVIAAPDGRCSLHAAVYERRAPWLATAGAGDVLAGFITGLLARGFAPMQAAEFAAWLHVECARSFGPGLIAQDLPEELPKVLKALSAQAAFDPD